MKTVRIIMAWVLTLMLAGNAIGASALAASDLSPGQNQQTEFQTDISGGAGQENPGPEAGVDPLEVADNPEDFLVDPETGYIVDPVTGLLIDPATGLFIDPEMNVSGEAGVDGSTDGASAVPAARAENPKVPVADPSLKLFDEPGSSSPLAGLDTLPSVETEPLASVDTEPSSPAGQQHSSSTEIAPLLIGEPEPISPGSMDPLPIGEPEPISPGGMDPLPIGEPEPISPGSMDPLPIGEPEPISPGGVDPLPIGEPEPISPGGMDPLPIGEPDPSPIGEPEPLPSADLGPSASVEPEPSASVEPEPSASVEPEPSASVEPEPSASVEPEPSASVEPEPSASVEPEPSASVEPEPSAELEVIQQEEVEISYDLRTLEGGRRVYNGSSQMAPVGLYRTTVTILDGVPGEPQVEQVATAGGGDGLSWSNASAESAGQYSVSVSGMDGENAVPYLEASWTIDQVEVDADAVSAAKAKVSLDGDQFTYGDPADVQVSLDDDLFSLDGWALSGGTVEDGVFANAGDYSVSYDLTLSDTDNYTLGNAGDLLSGEIAFNVEPMTITLDYLTLPEEIEPGTELEEIDLNEFFSSPVEGTELQWAEDGVVDETGVNTFQYSLVDANSGMSLADTGNYVVANSSVGIMPLDISLFSINPLTVEWSLNGSPFTVNSTNSQIYSGSSVGTFTAEVKDNGVPITPFANDFEIRITRTSSYAGTTLQDVGDYLVEVVFLTSSTYNDGTYYFVNGSFTFSVLPADLSITWEMKPTSGANFPTTFGMAAARVYDPAQEYTFVPTPAGMVGGDVVNPADYSLTLTTVKNVGEYTSTFALIPGSRLANNYKLATSGTSNPSTKFNITKQPVTVAWQLTPSGLGSITVANQPYSADSSYVFTPTLTPAISDFTVNVSKDGGAGVPNIYDNIKNAGTYQATLALTPAAAVNYELTGPATSSFVITPLAVSISPKTGLSKPYGKVDPTPYEEPATFTFPLTLGITDKNNIIDYLRAQNVTASITNESIASGTGVGTVTACPLVLSSMPNLLANYTLSYQNSTIDITANGTALTDPLKLTGNSAAPSGPHTGNIYYSPTAAFVPTASTYSIASTNLGVNGAWPAALTTNLGTPTPGVNQTVSAYWVRDTSDGFIYGPYSLTYSLNTTLPSITAIEGINSVATMQSDGVTVTVRGTANGAFTPKLTVTHPGGTLYGPTNLSVSGGNWSVTIPAPVTTNLQAITATVTDDTPHVATAGGSAPYIINMIDGEAPTVDSITVPTNPTPVSSVTVPIVVSDLGNASGTDVTAGQYQGVHSITIQGPGGTPETFTPIPNNGPATATFQYVATMNGDYVVTVRDLAGNTDTDSFKVMNIRSNGPVLTGGSPVVPLDATTDPIIPVTFKVADIAPDGTDPGSVGVDLAYFEVVTNNAGAITLVSASIDTAATSALPTEIAEFTFNVTANGTYTIQTRNKAGITMTTPVTFTIDCINTVPVSLISGPDYSETNATNQPVNVTFEVRDVGSPLLLEGHHGIKATIVDSATASYMSASLTHTDAPKTYTNDLPLDKNLTYTFTAIQVAENNDGDLGTTLSVPFSIDWIDTFPPALVDPGTGSPVAPPFFDPAPVPDGTLVPVTVIIEDEGTDDHGNPTASQFVGVDGNSITVVDPDGGLTHVSNYQFSFGVDRSTITFDADKNGNYVITGTDLAGNPFLPVTVLVDNISDGRPFVNSLAFSEEDATRGTVDVTIVLQDVHGTGQGASSVLGIDVNTVMIRHPDGSTVLGNGSGLTINSNPVNGQDTIEFTANMSGEYVLTAKNKAGNPMDPESYTISIDNILSKTNSLGRLASVGFAPNRATTSDVIVNFTVAFPKGDVAFTDSLHDNSNKCYLGLASGHGLEVECDKCAAAGATHIITPAVATQGDHANGHVLSGSFIAPCNGTYTIRFTDKAQQTDGDGPTELKVRMMGLIDRVDPVIVSCNPLPSYTFTPAPRAFSEVEFSVLIIDNGDDQATQGSSALGQTGASYYGIDKVVVTAPDGSAVAYNPGTMTNTAPTPGVTLGQYEANYTATMNGEYIIDVYDLAGNHAQHKQVITSIDNTVPIITERVPHNDVPTREPVRVEMKIVKPATPGAATGTTEISGYTVTAPDSVTIVASGGGTTQLPHETYNDRPALPTEPHTIYFWFNAVVSGPYTIQAVDQAGNTDTLVVWVDNIDKKPVELLSLDPTPDRKATNQSVRVAVNAPDTGDNDYVDSLGHQPPHIGVGKFTVVGGQYTNKTNFITPNIDAFMADLNTNYDVEVWDKAGYYDGVATPDDTGSIFVDWIDRETPEIWVGYYYSLPVTEPNRIPLIYTDTGTDNPEGGGNPTNLDYVGVASITVRGPGYDGSISVPVPKKAAYTREETFFLARDNGTYYITVTDFAGNSRTIEYVVDNFDHKGPYVSAWGYYDTDRPYMVVTASDDVLLKRVSVYKVNASGGAQRVYSEDVTEKYVKWYRFTYRPTSPGTYYAVATDYLGKSSTKSAFVSFGDVTDSDGDGIIDAMAALLGYPAVNPLGIPLATILHYGNQLRLDGETPEPGAFADAAGNRDLLSALSDGGWIDILGEGEAEPESLEAVQSMSGTTEILRLDYQNQSGIGVLGEYLVFFDTEEDAFVFTDAISLSDVAPLSAGESYVTLLSEDGNVLLIGVWNGRAITRDLVLLDLQNRIFSAVQGSAGATWFDLDAQGSQVAYVKNGIVNLLNLVTASAVQSAEVEVNALAFDETGVLQLSVTDGNRLTLVDGEVESAVYDGPYYPYQRGSSSQIAVANGAEGPQRAVYDGRMYLHPRMQSIYTVLADGTQHEILQAGSQQED